MLKRTALYEEHIKSGGRMVDFGGWELPVQYTGVLDEHTSCRSACGLFDVSHMGEVPVEGPGAEGFLNYLVTNNISKLATGQALYTAMCNESGGIVDDLVIYRRGTDRFFIVVNASNTDKDFAHMQRVAELWRSRNPGAFKLWNASAEYTQIAIQGRRAQEILQALTTTSLSTVKTYWFVEGMVLGSIPAILARTGYTGEDGFEVYVPWSQGPAVWRALLETGTPLGLKPCGLGARDTLRLEMKYALYGNELSETTNPLEAGLGWVVKMDKGDFVGRSAIERTKTHGLQRKLVGFRSMDRRIPRHGYRITDPTGQEHWGEVTSGTQSPSLGFALGVGYVPVAHSTVGSRLGVDVRGQTILVEVVETPFYKRPYSGA